MLFDNQANPIISLSRGIVDETPAEIDSRIQVDTAHVLAARAAIRLAPLNLPAEPHHTYDLHSSDPQNNFNLSSLVPIRKAHETKRAAAGVRTHFRSDGPADSDSKHETEEPIRRRIYRKMNAILKEDQEQRVNTGGSRKTLWTNSAPGGRSAEQIANLAGNSANAEMSAGQRALNVCHSS